MDFTGLADHINSSLTNEGYEVAVESIQAALDSFSPVEGENTEEAAVDEKHTCEKTVNGKDGPYVCGKDAKNEIGGLWYCGTEASGHYKSALTAEKKVSAPAKGKSSKGKSAPKGKAPKTASKSKSSALVSKIRKLEQIDFHEVVPDSGIWIESTYRIAADPDTNEAYGILADDNETILELSSDALTFLEAHSLNVREDAMPKLSPKAAPKGKVLSKVSSKGTVPKGKVSPKDAPKAAPKGKIASKSAPKAAPKGKVASKTSQANVAPKVVPKGKVPSKAVSKGKVPSKAAPKTAPKAAPKGKVSSKAKTTKKIPPSTEEDDATLNELQQGIKDAAVEGEPNVDEVVEDDSTGDEVGEEGVDVDFGVEGEGVEEEPDVDENAEEEGVEEEPDIVEEDEGEAIEDAEEDVEGGEDE